MSELKPFSLLKFIPSLYGSSNKNLVRYDGNLFESNRTSGNGSTSYYLCQQRRQGCKGRLILYNDKQTFRVSRGHDHHPETETPDRRAKDAALEKLRELTFSAKSGFKPIELVRMVLKDMPPESRHIMPNEESLARRVRRWAKAQGIQPTIGSSFLEYNADESLEVDVNATTSSSNTTTTQQCSSDKATSSAATATSVSNADDNTIVEAGTIKTFEPVPITDVIDADTGEAKPQSGLIFLKQKVDNHFRAMVNGKIFQWGKDLQKLVQLYLCREVKRGCRTKLIIYLKEKRYEVRGTHAHYSSRKGPGAGTGWKKRCVPNLTLVDDDGNELRPATMDDIYANPFATPLDSGCNDNILEPTSLTAKKNQQSAQDETFAGDDFMDDVVREDGYPVEEGSEVPDGKMHAQNEQIMSFPSEFKTLTSSRTFQSNLSTANAKKTEQRCFVCGDELVYSETLASSEETFRKACCYLNVRSEREWFPKSSAGQFYSFCESCTKEIYRIHDLNKKVEEIQSMIFKKVEHVEKRVVDAEIVDTWMAEAPSSTFIRFEGFRKQIMINYRNKLKLRREVRVGRKIGKKLSEATPVITAQMFATDPSHTDVFRKVNLDQDNLNKFSTSHKPHSAPTCKTRGRPKSKRRPELQQETQTRVEESSEYPHDNLGFQDYDDDRSVSSEKDVKFWHEDPSKLRIDCDNAGLNKKFDFENDHADDDCNTAGGDNGDDRHELAESEDDDDTDYDAVDDDDDDDDDWAISDRKKKKPKTRKLITARQSGQTNSKSPQTSSTRETEMVPKSASQVKQNKDTVKDTEGQSSSKSNKSGRGRIHFTDFPETFVRRDGRIFMQGIEIIKNPPGHYPRRPYSASFSCGECGKVVVSFWGIRRHICGHHLGLYKCPICFKQYSEPRMVTVHLETKHGGGEKISLCQVCQKPFKKERTMELHRWTHLSEEEKKDPANAKYQPRKDPTRSKAGCQTFMCSYCSKTFYIPSALKKHEMIHTGDAPKEQCQYCGRLFAVKKRLYEHVQKCAKIAQGIVDNTTYPCPKCPVRFKSRATRSKHIRRFHRHGNQSSLPFSCPKCPRSFSTKSAFKNHRRLCMETSSGAGIEERKKKIGSSEKLDVQSSSSRTHDDYKVDTGQEESSKDNLSQSQSRVYSSQSGALDQNAVAMMGLNYNVFSYQGASLFSNPNQPHGM